MLKLKGKLSKQGADDVGLHVSYAIMLFSLLSGMAFVILATAFASYLIK